MARDVKSLATHELVPLSNELCCTNANSSHVEKHDKVPRVKKRVSQVQSSSPKGKGMMNEKIQPRRGKSGSPGAGARQADGMQSLLFLASTQWGRGSLYMATVKLQNEMRNQGGCHRNPEDKEPM